MFLYNFHATLDEAKNFGKLYQKRWNIETGIKQLKHNVRLRTFSNNYFLKAFDYMFTLLLYNLWFFVNLLVTLSAEGEFKHKNHVTMEIFIEYLLQEPWEYFEKNSDDFSDKYLKSENIPYFVS